MFIPIRDGTTMITIEQFHTSHAYYCHIAAAAVCLPANVCNAFDLNEFANMFGIAGAHRSKVCANITSAYAIEFQNESLCRFQPLENKLTAIYWSSASPSHAQSQS